MLICPPGGGVVPTAAARCLTSSPPRRQVSEDAAVGSRFYQLSAVDPDVASPEDLVFSLVEAESAVSENGKPVNRPNRDYKVRKILQVFSHIDFTALH